MLKNRKLIAQIGLLVTALIWGSTFLIVKDAINLKTFPPFIFAAIRFSLAAVCIIFLVDFKSIRKNILGPSLCGLVLFIGYGFQNYSYAHIKYLQDVELIYVQLKDYNYNDGASNFAKLIVEFGVFNFLFLILFVLFLINKNINLQLKIFIITIIITQLIRGAGYFNGSFAFFIFIGMHLLLNNHYNLLKTHK